MDMSIVYLMCVYIYIYIDTGMDISFFCIYINTFASLLFYQTSSQSVTAFLSEVVDLMTAGFEKAIGSQDGSLMGCLEQPWQPCFFSGDQGILGLSRLVGGLGGQNKF